MVDEGRRGCYIVLNPRVFAGDSTSRQIKGLIYIYMYMYTH